MTINNMLPAISIHESEFIPLSDKALFWSHKKTLIATDLHWFKEEIGQNSGIPLPNVGMRNDLIRLRNLIDQYKVERLMILGDLVHHARGIALAEESAKLVTEFRKTQPIPFQLILGNHDRGLLKKLPSEWNIEAADIFIEDQFAFVHDSDDAPKGYFTFSGHVHPVVYVANRRESFRLPCFAFSESHGLLPSFGSMTGGYPIDPKDFGKIFAVAGKGIVTVKSD